MKRLVGVLLVLSLILAGAPGAPASADTGANANTGDRMRTKTLNTGANTLFGWVDCPKAMADEFSKANERLYVGVLVTAPLMCGVNTAVRYLGVAADIMTLPWGDNLVQPGVLQKPNPPVTLP